MTYRPYSLFCPGCKVTFQRRGTYMNHGRGKKATCTPELRFWGRVTKSDGCWLWQGRLDALGYGRFDRHGPRAYAHRTAWELTHGPVPAGMDICHTCDVRRCCNPSHMFLGTAMDNMADAKRKKRHAWGQRNRHATLTDAQAAEVRARFRKYGPRRSNATELAKLYNTTPAVICAIGRGHTWRYLDTHLGDLHE